MVHGLFDLPKETVVEIWDKTLLCWTGEYKHDSALWVTADRKGIWGRVVRGVKTVGTDFWEEMRCI